MTWPDWSNETCVIVASGPSAAYDDLSRLKGQCKCIAVNTSYRLVPWADILYAADARWWLAERGASDFHGLKATCDQMAAERFGLELLQLTRGYHDLVLNRPGYVGIGGHSGFHALNMATGTLLCKRVVLVGFDLTLANGSHWHSDHKDKNPLAFNMKNWRRRLDDQAIRLQEAGIEVINTSPISALQNYRKMALKEIFP